MCIQHGTCVLLFHVRLVGPIDCVPAAGSARIVPLPTFEEGINLSSSIQQSATIERIRPARREETDIQGGRGRAGFIDDVATRAPSMKPARLRITVEDMENSDRC